MTEPIRITFDVDCTVAHAFEVWTARISSWWPRSHTVSAQADADVVLERPRRRAYLRADHGGRRA